MPLAPQAVPETYANLGAVATAHQVSRPAVSQWVKHGKWPGPPLAKAKIDAFVRDWIVPHRRGKKPPLPSVPTTPHSPTPPPAPSPAAPTAPAAAAQAKPAKPSPSSPSSTPSQQSPPAEALPKTLQELETAIKLARTDWEADLLATQVRALKGLQDVMERQGELLPKSEVDAGRVARILAVKAAMFNLPAQISAKLVGLSEEDTQAVLTGEMVKICAEFARN